MCRIGAKTRNVFRWRVPGFHLLLQKVVLRNTVNTKPTGECSMAVCSSLAVGGVVLWCVSVLATAGFVTCFGSSIKRKRAPSNLMTVIVSALKERSIYLFYTCWGMKHQIGWKPTKGAQGRFSFCLEVCGHEGKVGASRYEKKRRAGSRRL